MAGLVGDRNSHATGKRRTEHEAMAAEMGMPLDRNARILNPCCPLSCERMGPSGVADDPAWMKEAFTFLGRYDSFMHAGGNEVSWLKEGSLDHVFKRPGEMVPATIMALEAYGKPWDTAAAVARKALDISADCPEAWHVLGLASDSVEEALQCFRRGVAARETALSDKEWQEAEGDPWGCYPLRGWLRCVIGEANCLRKLGAPAAAEALRQYRALAAMQSKTHGWCSFINFNYHLPEVYLRAGDLDGFDALWAADKEITIERTVFMSTQLAWMWSYVLRDYLREPVGRVRWNWCNTGHIIRVLGSDYSDREDTAQRMALAGGAVYHAWLEHPHVAELLLGEKELPAGPLPSVFGAPGGWVQAVVYVHSCRDLWDAGAVAWLQRQVNTFRLMKLLDKITSPFISADLQEGWNKVLPQCLGLLDKITSPFISATQQEGWNKVLLPQCLGLIQSEAAVDLQTPDDEADCETGPLHMAGYYDMPEQLVRALLQAGASPVAPGGGNTAGYSPIAMAAQQGNHRPLRLMLAFCKEQPQWADREARVQALLLPALVAMLDSQCYPCSMGIGYPCNRCEKEKRHAHGRGVSFEACLDLLVLHYGYTELVANLLNLDYDEEGVPLNHMAILSYMRTGFDGKEKPFCSVCGMVGGDPVGGGQQLLRCSLCKARSYCSAACQKADWKTHKSQCSPPPTPSPAAAAAAAAAPSQPSAPAPSSLLEAPVQDPLASAPKAPACSVCGMVGGAPLGGGQQLLRCSLCKARSYCSSACQKADWKTHKAQCSPPPTPSPAAAAAAPPSQPLAAAPAAPAQAPTAPETALLQDASKAPGCSVCGMAGGDPVGGGQQLLRCSLCKARSYCSAACQKADWKTHKSQCSPPPTPSPAAAAAPSQPSAPPPSPLPEAPVQDPPAPAPKAPACSVCGMVGGAPLGGGQQLLRCSLCKARSYCSAACQKADWKTHKAQCRPPPPSQAGATLPPPPSQPSAPTPAPLPEAPVQDMPAAPPPPALFETSPRPVAQVQEPPAPTRKAPACSVCGAKGRKLKACARCRSRRYCSTTCQKKDWKGGHKADCKDAADVDASS